MVFCYTCDGVSVTVVARRRGGDGYAIVGQPGKGVSAIRGDRESDRSAVVNHCAHRADAAVAVIDGGVNAISVDDKGGDDRMRCGGVRNSVTAVYDAGCDIDAVVGQCGQVVADVGRDC